MKSTALAKINMTESIAIPKMVIKVAVLIRFAWTHWKWLLKVAVDTVVHVWKRTSPDYKADMARVTAAGYRVILSAPWYLNRISYGADWKDAYVIEPVQFNGTSTIFIISFQNSVHT